MKHVCQLLVGMAFLEQAFTCAHSQEAQAKSATQRALNSLIQKERQISSVKAKGVETVLSSQHYRSRLQEDLKHLKLRGQVNVKDSSTTWYLVALKKNKELYASINKSNMSKSESIDKIKHQDFLNNNRFIFDGKETYAYVENQNGSTQINIQPNKMIQNSLTLYRDVPFEGFSLHDAIKSEKYKYVGSDADPQFGKLDKYRGESTSGTIDFWLASEKDFLVVKGEMRSPKSLLKFRVDEIANISGQWLPVKYAQESYQIKEQKPLLERTRQMALTEMSINDVGDEFFNIKMQPGYHVKYSPTNEYWRVGQNGEKINIDLSANKKSTMSWGWLYMASVTSLLVLTVLGYVRWKSKQWSKAV